MDRDLERATLVALLRRGDRYWSELTDRIETVGSAHEVLTSSLDASGQGTLFDTHPAPIGQARPRGLSWETLVLER